MSQNTINVTAQDLHAVIRGLQDENTNLKMVNASLTRQYVETQAEHAKCGKGKDAKQGVGASPVAKDA